MKNKTQPYLAGRFFDSISSGLFMMALPWVMLSEPKMGTFVALVSLSCTAISFLTTPFFSTLVDRHSRKALLVLNQWIQSGMALVVFIAYWLGFESHWLLRNWCIGFRVTLHGRPTTPSLKKIISITNTQKFRGSKKL